ncbi:MAG TPA: MMPL family transporter [Nocardioides sp.]|uniref:MMPL family transporter n=1 Tax=Nocardioides sp. TaxID=35761 RepID=UPI002C5B760B|nr:MMPL family transporter [Nocardioides sp.]HQR25766.1 MMPL family transporter [Nocardioides sp.]
MPDLTSLTVRRGRSWWVAIVLVVAALATIGLLGEAERDASTTDTLPEGKDSTAVVELQRQLPQAEGSTAVVLYTADSGALAPAALEELQGRYPATDQGPGLVVSKDGTAAIAVVPVTEPDAQGIADEVERIRAEAADGLPAGVSSQVTGPAAVQADLAAVFDGANLRLLLATASVVGILLLITYRSPFLWLVPLIVVGIADRLAAVLATQTLDVLGMAWDESTVGILSVLVFGAGTDYALLLISRYRDELRTHTDRYEAMRLALRRTAEAVLSSAVTVVLGLLTLLLSLIPSTRGLGMACAVGIVVAAFYALVVLPTVLVLFGRWVFWPLVPRVGQPTLVDSDRSVWRRIGRRVQARPPVFIIGSTLLLALLAVGVTQIETGLSESDQFLDKPEAIAAAERLAESFPAGTSDPTIVITRQDPAQVVGAIEGVPGVESARPVTSGDGLSEIDVVLAAGSGTGAAEDTVVALRDALASYDGTWVGGTEAESIDSAAATSRDRLVIIPLILVVVLGALFILLRSVVAPLILVSTVVGTYLASLGLSWWLFTGVFGFERLDSGVPLLAFLFLVALGVDYNIFLVSRAAEEARGHGTSQGMLRALTATGGVITSAGILLAAVFAVLGVLPLVVLAQLGVVICVGVLLDTLLVRTVLVPAIAWWLGERFWWPRRLV